MRRPWVALTASLALAGCGGDDDEKGRAVTVPAGAAVRVGGHEYAFDPQTITVEKAGELRITLRNDGSLAHDLRIRRGDRDIGGTPAFQGGQRTVRLRLARGRYRFLCTVGDHEKLGMVGTLRVR
jgi:plastocyanin